MSKAEELKKMFKEQILKTDLGFGLGLTPVTLKEHLIKEFDESLISADESILNDILKCDRQHFPSLWWSYKLNKKWVKNKLL